MPLLYLLDTNIVSFHIRQSSPKLQRRLKAISAAHVGLSVITEMEIRYGLVRNPTLRIAPLVESFLSAITIAPIDSTVSGTYAKIRHQLDASGSPIGPLDLMIAAHARTLGVILITNNLREFQRVDGLRCEDWSA